MHATVKLRRSIVYTRLKHSTILVLDKPLNHQDECMSPHYSFTVFNLSLSIGLYTVDYMSSQRAWCFAFSNLLDWIHLLTSVLTLIMNHFMLWCLLQLVVVWILNVKTMCNSYSWCYVKLGHMHSCIVTNIDMCVSLFD